MKLQKHISRRCGNKEYTKYVVVINPRLIEKLGWEDGDELKSEIRKSALIIEKD